MCIQGRANCPLNERRQIQANSRGNRDGMATASARLTSLVFAAERKQNASQRSDRLTLPANTLGLQMMVQRLTSACIVSRLANLPICVYNLRDSLTYKPLIMNLGSTDPIALSIVTHFNSTARAEACHRQASARAAKEGRTCLQF